METALDFKTYKYKVNGIDTIVWRPADKKQKYGLFQQDKNGKFTIDVLNKYYNIPPYNSKFNEVYDSVVKDIIVEISIKDIIKKVKQKIKKFKGEILHLVKHHDGTFEVPLNQDETESITKNLKSPKFHVDNMNKNELKLLLAYLYPHVGISNNSKEINIDTFVDEFNKSENYRKNIYVDKEAFMFLRTGIHGLA